MGTDHDHAPSKRVRAAHPLKDTQIWYTFLINGESFMTKVTASKSFQTSILKKCTMPPPPKF